VGGIDIYMGVSLCVVLWSLRVVALGGDSGHCGWLCGSTLGGGFDFWGGRVDIHIRVCMSNPVT
jgi:hypothetical protein